MRIESWNDEEIRFSDGSTITFGHDQDCCEWNYADFTVLEVFYDGCEFSEYRVEPCEDGFLLKLLCGVIWKAIFIPCYSYQNGYYSSDVDIYINGDCETTICGKWIEG